MKRQRLTGFCINCLKKVQGAIIIRIMLEKSFPNRFEKCVKFYLKFVYGIGPKVTYKYRTMAEMSQTELPFANALVS